MARSTKAASASAPNPCAITRSAARAAMSAAARRTSVTAAFSAALMRSMAMRSRRVAAAAASVRAASATCAASARACSIMACASFRACSRWAVASRSMTSASRLRREASSSSAWMSLARLSSMEVIAAQALRPKMRKKITKAMPTQVRGSPNRLSWCSMWPLLRRAGGHDLADGGLDACRVGGMAGQPGHDGACRVDRDLAQRTHGLVAGDADALLGFGELALELLVVDAGLLGGFGLRGGDGAGDLGLRFGGRGPAAFGDLGRRRVRLLLGEARAVEVGQNALLARVDHLAHHRQ